MTPHPDSPAKLEPLLRDACRRALRLGLSFADQIRLCRSVIALAREVRLLFGNVSSRAGEPPLPALLAAVCDRVCDLGLDPTLPLPDAVLVQRLATGLSRAARLAEGPVAARGRSGAKNRDRLPAPAAPADLGSPRTQPSEEPLDREPEKNVEHPIQREAAPNRDRSAVPPAPADLDPPRTQPSEEPLDREPEKNVEHPIQREAAPNPDRSAVPPAPADLDPPRTQPSEEPLDREPEKNVEHPIQREAAPNPDRSAVPPAPADRDPPDMHSTQVPLHREPAADDDRLSAWRKDHTTERDKEAHERLRTVLEERIFKPSWAEGRRLRAEREAMPPASPASASGPPYGAGSPPPASGFDPASAHPPAPLAAE
jgi:hypothetical protein